MDFTTISSPPQTTPDGAAVVYPHTNGTEQTALARYAIGLLLDKKSPNGATPAQLGRYGELYSEMLQAHQAGGYEALRRVYVTYADRDPAVAALRAADEEDAPEVHPLQVAAVRNLQLGWIDEYVTLLTGLTGAPREFNQLSALVTVATVIQRKARLRMTFGDVYSNIYACIIARSSVYHKSSAIQKPRLFLQRAMLEKLLLSELMTSEGLLAQLQTQSAGVILRDEIGTLYGSHSTKYLAQLKPDLTALYDGYPYSRRLSNAEVKVEKPYLNILGATTPTRFFEGVALTDWTDGFLARWLFVLPEGEPDFDAMTGLYAPEHDIAIGKLAMRLMHIDQQRETDFILKGDAHQLWDTWQRQAAKDAYYFGDDISAAIVTRYSAYALKFALILSAVNGDWGIITPETMQTAMHLSDNYKGYVHKLLTEKRNYGISGAKLQKVFGAILHLVSTEGKATTKRIMQTTHMQKSELEPCLDKLAEIGAVIPEKAGNGQKYMPTTQELPIKAWK